jgi:hypothetical protein
MMADYSYLQHVMEENAKLSAQIATLLPWARLATRTARTDGNWEDAERLLARIEAGEFGEVK